MKEEKDNTSEWMYFLGVVAIVGVFIIAVVMANPQSASHEKVLHKKETTMSAATSAESRECGTYHNGYVQSKNNPHGGC